ncbi:hypothetical protein [Mesorhizobium sp. M7A.F.Ca.CA.004.06.1.1]|uniref:hypothetical protein n=2 Tax=unclassified Mesorhizobium TaxID=325217 RepID=UPI0026D50107
MGTLRKPIERIRRIVPVSGFVTRIKILGQSRVERIIVEIDIASRVPSRILEFIKHKVVNIRIGRLGRANMPVLLRRGFVKIPVEVADKIGRFLGGLGNRRQGGDSRLSRDGLTGDQRRARRHGTQQRIQLVFQAPFVRGRGMRRRRNMSLWRRRLDRSGSNLGDRLFGRFGKRVVQT